MRIIDFFHFSTLKILKTLLEHDREMADQEWGIPDE